MSEVDENLRKARDIQSILSDLCEAAETPFEAARSLPPAAYTSESLLDLEVERIFETEWVCVGRTAEIPSAGDFLTFSIAGRPVMAIRQADQTLRVFANACLHRCAKLLEGRGSTQRIICPYHAWTYGIDGSLLGAPHMEKTEGFQVKGEKLAELRCEIWEGFIYATFSETTPPLADRLAALQSVIGRYSLADYEPVLSEDEIWDTNWKCLVENFMDAYHVFKVHSKTFDAQGDNPQRTKIQRGGGQYSYHLVDAPSDGTRATAHPDNRTLEGEWRKTLVLAAIFPTHTMQVQPDMLWYLSIQPQGTDQVRLRWALSIPPEILADTDRDSVVKKWGDLLSRVNEEDKAVVSAVREGLNLENTPRGRLSHLERNVWEFGRYYASIVNGLPRS